MNSPQVEILSERDRPALVDMLEDAGDLHLGTVDLYRRARNLADTMLVAWVDDSLVGMFNASYTADLHGIPPFESFHLPPLPHAFMDRIHVHPGLRGDGVGRALVQEFIRIASDRRCKFAGGHVDASSDPTGRTKFFEKVGFEIRGDPSALTVGRFL